MTSTSVAGLPWRRVGGACSDAADRPPLADTLHGACESSCEQAPLMPPLAVVGGHHGKGGSRVCGTRGRARLSLTLSRVAGAYSYK